MRLCRKRRANWRSARVVADALYFSAAIPCALTGGVFLKGVLLEKYFREAAVEAKLKPGADSEGGGTGKRGTRACEGAITESISIIW